MSTSDTPNIDQKKQNVANVVNDFNIGGFAQSLLTNFVYMLIYIFVSALVLYGTKIYGPKITPPPPETIVDKGKQFLRYLIKNGGGDKVEQPTFDKYKIIYEPPVITFKSKMHFINKQISDTYGYTLEALIVLFHFLYDINDQILFNYHSFKDIKILMFT